LQNVGEVGIELDVDGELVSIAFSDIDKARLIPNI
jgi:ribosome maturation factor RimP